MISIVCCSVFAAVVLPSSCCISFVPVVPSTTKEADPRLLVVVIIDVRGAHACWPRALEAPEVCPLFLDMLSLSCHDRVSIWWVQSTTVLSALFQNADCWDECRYNYTLYNYINTSMRHTGPRYQVPGSM